MSIARTAATGGAGMLPELIRWSSSLAIDQSFLREDLVGSLAHALMLQRTGIIPAQAGEAIVSELWRLIDELGEGKLSLEADEEDVHMAVERLLTARLGELAGHLHTARSRNDQVALDLRLHTREAGRQLLAGVLALLRGFVARAHGEREVLLPTYTHRQRAQPASAALYFAAWSQALLRAARSVTSAVGEADVLPLGAGASSGSSLPIDRQLTRQLLGFSRVSHNALDTVGDRDFALDFVWGSTRVMLALSRFAQDMIDFSTSEFGFVVLDGEIAAGSSMMPQKKNPDVFELVRGKSAGGVGRLVQLLTLVRALPTGYNRDLQEDRQALLGAAREALDAVEIVRLVLPHVRFDRARCAAALASGFTQATDLAEQLVRRGVPFREAYRATGALVRRALDRGETLTAMTTEDARTVHPAFDATVLAALDPEAACAAKESLGGTGPRALDQQLAALEHDCDALERTIAAIPSLDSVVKALREQR